MGFHVSLGECTIWVTGAPGCLGIINRGQSSLEQVFNSFAAEQEQERKERIRVLVLGFRVLGYRVLGFRV